MDKRSLVLFLSGLAAAGAVVGIAASCSDQPRIKCTAGHGQFAVKYTVTSGDPDGCGLKGEKVGFEAYSYPLPNGSNLDPNRGSVAFQTETIDSVLAEHHFAPNIDAGQVPYHHADWATAEPGADNFCTTRPLNAVNLDLPAVPASDAGPAVPPGNISYTWSNVRVYAEPRAPGTQMIADVEYSRTQGDGGTCTATFKAVGLWPAVDCYKEEGPDDAKVKVVDNEACNPVAAPPARPLGSGISPDIAYVCDPVLFMCVLAKDPPSFK